MMDALINWKTWSRDARDAATEAERKYDEVVTKTVVAAAAAVHSLWVKKTTAKMCWEWRWFDFCLDTTFDIEGQ